MSSMSIAIIVGRLTRDAELKYTNNGQAICHFSVATSTRKKKGDQWTDEPSFWDVDLWGKQGESLNQYLTKGKLVGIEGPMAQDRWEQDGQQRMKVRINANSVQLLSGQSSEDSHRATQTTSDGSNYGQPPKPSSQPAPRAAQPRQAAVVQPALDDFADDIPF
jgi:single-strand DNA-binding protein